MYKVMIVDDEIPAREILLCIINWEDTDFRIVYSASNGKDALDKYTDIKPDLIITDIQMPIIDGLDLIEEVQKINKSQKFLILSCYEDFTYAQRAMKMGVTDYLIKDLITPNDLYGILAKTQTDLDNITIKKSEIKKEHKLLNFLKENKDIALRKLIFNDISQDDCYNLIENLNLNLNGKLFVLFLIQIDNFFKYIEDENFYTNTLNEIIKNVSETIEELNIGECFYSENGEFTAIVRLSPTISEADIINECYYLAQEIRKRISLMHNISLTISVSSTFKKPFKIKKYFDEAFKLSKMKVFLGNDTIILNNTFVKNLDLDTDTLAKRINAINIAIEQNNIENLKSELTHLYDKDIRGFMQFNYLNYINSSLLDLVVRTCNRYSIAYEDIFSTSYLPIEILSTKETVEEMSGWFIEIFTKIININFNNSFKNKYSKKVADSIDYINKNLFNQSLSLTDIAENINVHKVYLCRIFKEETGENVTQYILKARIDKSKEIILSTNYKLYEISDKLGFNSPQQFSILFKKVTGITPNQFRDSYFKNL
ncbi:MULTISPECIES: response regulator transcription factor [Clostridium]|jgi:Response regulator containing CheY-like receiver domain and AraC-type DNA-binding domain|uniref:Stage 0 sporulation protein A homolog n=2 Tax=Clostridium beijerinckii TaxID=1520 RepID=A0AAE2V410_CLOBE|nr:MULTISPECIES: response regulator [Clostridium]ABR33560.1 response regulator receiver protein [Clostridium beijerinckii NCIMB 8052]AIU02509.1 response regulator receiver protein [Clostridium beijerinckii ATCC 35702]MBF7811976.1 response regulator [Clostridium beijerinckii]NRT25172.1 two-component system response regulator YesN [Clostridium beijerinckii]NRT67234.1 two-component system response regulator YesN [Clostridium beijerinckii]